MRFTLEDLKKENLFRNKQEKTIWKVIAHTDNPTVTIENMKTKERRNLVVDCPIANEYERFEKKEEKLKE